METSLEIERKYYHDFIEDNCSKGVCRSDLQLPFFHSCSGEQFRKIIGSGEIITTECSEFSEELLYLFYGKPSYRLNDDKITRDLGYFPTSFLIKDISYSIKRIFPFDSGAFLNDVLKDACGSFETKDEARIDICRYDLGCKLDLLAKFIKVLYGDDRAYFNVTPCLHRDKLKGFCFELSRLLDMAQSHSTHDWDARATTIEIQANSSIKLDGNSIEAIIIPAQLISNDQELQEYFYAQDIRVETYNAARSKPSNVTDLIDSVARDYLTCKGLI